MRIKRLLLIMVCLVCVMWCAAAVAETPVCGTEGSSYDYCWSDGEQYYDDDFHWYICQYCGSEMDKFPHWSTCDGVGECCACFAPYFGENVNSHYADCEQTDVCIGCGQTMENLPIGSHGDFTMGANATYHWETCEDCDRVVMKEAHFVRCDAEDKTVCNECDTALSNPVVHHQWKYEDLGNGMHQRTCKTCGTTEQEAHSAICESMRTDICDRCDAVVESAVRHSSGYIDFDADTHWLMCVLCCDKFNVEAHYTSEGDPAGICSHCGVTTAKVAGQLMRLSDSAAYYDAPGGTAKFTYADLDAEQWQNLMDYYDEPVTSGGYTWYQVAENGGMYYLRSDAVKVLPQQTGYVVTYNWQANIYNAPAGNRVIKYVYDRVTLPYYGQPVQSVTEDLWYLVVYDNVAGYVRGNDAVPCSSEGEIILQDPATCKHNFAGGGTVCLDDLYHVDTCLLCGVMDLESKYPHSAQCISTACDICGAEGVTLSEVWHSHTETQLVEGNTEQHAVYCFNCEQVFDMAPHFVRCSDENAVCMNCGMQGCTKADYLHENWGYIILNDKYHAWGCVDCGYYNYREAHGASCKNPGVCNYCNAPCEDAKVDFHSNWTRAYDEEGHWWYCADCGEDIGDKYEHESTCDDPYVCSACGQPCDGSNVANHTDIDWYTWYYDETSHWYQCNDCGGQANKTEHQACCTLPGVCDICLMGGYSGENIFHSSHYDYEDSEWKWVDYERHQYTCGWCGMVEIQEHWNEYDPMWCQECDGRVADMNAMLALPEDLTAIEAQAFYGVTGVKDVVLPEGVKTIGSQAFANSTVENINLPASIEYIADDAFEGCDITGVMVWADTYACDWARAHGMLN